MKNRRYSDNDKHLWPFTLSKTSYTHYGIMLDSGAKEDFPGDCHIRFYAGKYVLICELPQIIPDFVVRRYATGWDPATIERLGRNYYDTHWPNEYGFTVFEGSVHVHYGAQTFDSLTTKSKVFFLPWCHWTHKRRSLFNDKGEHFWTEYDVKDRRTNWVALDAVENACPKIKFEFYDYDGERIEATTHIEEREWHFGTGMFKWLSWFRKPKIRRTLSIRFNKEVGREKGSWKGGTIGTGIDMLPGELHEAAFKRFCELDHRSKYGQYQITFIGQIKEDVLL